ncbi:MAG TPA: DUF4824 family protein [Burkholderiales bacterium]
MKRSHTRLAGLVLLALTNAIALGGALWNRSGEPQARMRLTERELQRFEPWYGNRENSGLTLRLRWRTLVEERTAADFYSLRYGSSGGAPGWLDRAKMESLGFDTSMLAAYSERARKRYEKQLPREVLLVLELDGAAYRRALELTRERVDGELAKPFIAGDRAAEERRKSLRETLDWETSRSSRLFVVDAGTDADALRAKYQDRARYAIVRGEARPWAAGAGSGRAAGIVDSVSVASINVPLRLRGVLAGVQALDYAPAPRTPFDATVAWGRRFEPWLVEAARR